ncbi:hypothetical protein FGE12_25885 [Aggregicoccus sp. 17bor-14]|nr:hypothetical protein [Simulacricoccus sp. 17bor-14]MRI91601.1 hypothetical protein [Aggregicoccus sp. 17bor-14]
MHGDRAAAGEGRGNRWRPALWGSAALLLLLPLVAMRFTHEVHWTPFDFAVMGTMLAVACGGYELAARMKGSTAYRAGAGLAILAAFCMLWVNLAVGIIGSEDNPANGLFVAVLAVGVAGAIVARGEAQGMVRALTVTAAAQALVALVALRHGSPEGTAFSVLLCAAWLASAGLFHRAARERTGTAP